MLMLLRRKSAISSTMLSDMDASVAILVLMNLKMFRRSLKQRVAEEGSRRRLTNRNRDDSATALSAISCYLRAPASP